MLTYRARIVLDTLLPGGAHPNVPYGLFDVDFDDFYQRFCDEAPWVMQAGFHAGLAGAIWLAPLLIGRVPPITLYDRATRERALRALTHARFNGVRQLGLILRMTAAFCYGADPRVRDAIGFPRQFDDPRSREHDAA